MNPSVKPTVGRPILNADLSVVHPHLQQQPHLQQMQRPDVQTTGRHRGTLPPIPVNEDKTEGKSRTGGGGFLGYDKKCSAFGDLTGLFNFYNNFLQTLGSWFKAL